MICHKDSSQSDRYIPIASTYTFNNYWKPICKEFNLEWIDLMKSAAIVFPEQVESIPAIIRELATMKAAISDESRIIPDSVRQEIVLRINLLISEIRQIQNAPDEIDKATIF